MSKNASIRHGLAWSRSPKQAFACVVTGLPQCWQLHRGIRMATSYKCRGRYSRMIACRMPLAGSNSDKSG